MRLLCATIGLFLCGLLVECSSLGILNKESRISEFADQLLIRERRQAVDPTTPPTTTTTSSSDSNGKEGSEASTGSVNVGSLFRGNNAAPSPPSTARRQSSQATQRRGRFRPILMPGRTGMRWGYMINGPNPNRRGPPNSEEGNTGTTQSRRRPMIMRTGQTALGFINTPQGHRQVLILNPPRRPPPRRQSIGFGGRGIWGPYLLALAFRNGFHGD